MTTSTVMTAQDLERLPRDGRRYDLIKGVLKRMAPAGGPHQVVTGRFITYLNEYLEPRNLGTAGGEGGFIFADDPDTVLGPDVSIILAEQFPSIQAPGYMRIVPPLVVEVLSPSNRRAEIETKVAI
jgi:Uma2 family endonuclease